MNQTTPTARSRAKPTGTVTFLFTDIEGSTKLVQALGAAAWTPLLERHRALVRGAIEAEGGYEVQTDGDGFFAVFASAPAAVGAAVRAQRALANESWPPDAVIRVRMGLHTGEGRLDADGGFVGVDVHRAARIASAGHGGQVVLSETTRSLVARDLPHGVTIVDLGEHRLKDLRVERLSQLAIDGLMSEFPRLKSLDVRPNNLPTQLTSFVGRERELAEAAELLRLNRLVTLSGPGGTGKSRLSLQLAAAVSDQFPDGIWFVPLEPIRDPALVAPTIAHALGIAPNPGRPDVDAIAEWLGMKRVLLVLDNFEQVLSAAPVVTQLLRAAPELRIVVTSRAPLRVYGEQEYPVPGLPAPPDTSRLSPIEVENLPADVRHPSAETLNQYEAVRLFIARAVSIQPGFSVTNETAPAIAQICARLNGMPLAIELTAARVKLLSPAQILTRLEHQLSLLTSGSRDLPERQQTLRGAIAWSYELLDEPARELLDRLSIFSGGWDLEAAEAICGISSMDVLDGLQGLVDQSLVRRIEHGDDIRFEMFPTIQEFAAEKLAARGEAREMAEQHARIYLARAETAAPQLGGTEQRVWLDRLERDHDNFRAALDWATENPDADVGVGLGFALWRFWQKRGYLNEARSRLTELEERTRPLPPLLAARLYEALGGIAYWRADGGAAIHWYDGALEAWRKIGDKREVANALYNRAYVDILAMMEGVQSTFAVPEPDTARSRAQLEEALQLYREAGDRPGEGNVLWGLGCHFYFTHFPDKALPWFEQALKVFISGGDRTMEAWCRHMLAITVVRLGRVDAARAHAQAALKHFHDAGDLAGVTLLFGDLAGIAAANGDMERAGRLMGAARNLQALTGTGLVGYVEELFDGEAKAKLQEMGVERFQAEGANTPLDRLVAYALEARPAAG
jgi:predicted ATPase/class 3 adenylate cyclase